MVDMLGESGVSPSNVAVRGETHRISLTPPLDGSVRRQCPLVRQTFSACFYRDSLLRADTPNVRDLVFGALRRYLFFTPATSSFKNRCFVPVRF